MNASRPIRVLVVRLSVALAAVLVPQSSRADLILDSRLHHLRSGKEREWAEFPEQAESAELLVRFDASANAAERTIRLRLRDVKQVWHLRLNGRDLGALPQDENETVTYWPVPPGVLRDGANELRLSCGGGPSDDVLVGEVELLDRPRRQALSEATLDVTVTDGGGGTPLPCRLTIADSHGGLVSLGTPSDAHLAVRPGVVYTGDGHARIELPAGRYTLYAGRGFEYSLDSAALDLRPGETATKKLSIRRVVPTDGYVSCDTHVHTFTYSRHGDATIEERMLTLAGEGIELPVATDHNLQIDYDPAATKTGVRRYFTPVIGNEVTTAALGHFNVFPVPKEAKLLNWRVRGWDALARKIAETIPEAPAAGRPNVILNHARDDHGGFRPFDPRRHVGLTGEDLDGWTVPANAMEVVNSGATQTDPMRLIEDWFGMLNRGQRLTPVGASDSHDVSRYIVGQGRTYIRCPDGDPGRIDVARAARAFAEGRVLVSYGLLADLTVAGRYGPGDLAPAGGDLDVEVRVLGPGWTKATRVALYANGVKAREAEIARRPGEPEPEGVKWRGTWTLPRMRHDVYLVAVATGPGVTAPHWPTAKPYQPASAEWRPYVLGLTGAVWVDADGSGRFDSAYDYASRVVQSSGGDWAAVVAKLADYDEAVAAQAASLLRARSEDGFDEKARDAIKNASPTVRRGFEAYLRAWAESKAARGAEPRGH
jgi:hypothetical protein